MATTHPTVKAAAIPVLSVQPISRNTADVPMSDAMVIPLVGLEVTPTSPTIREATVTKKNAKTTTHTAAIALTARASIAPNTCGTRAMASASATTATMTKPTGRSRPVRGTTASAPPRRAFNCLAPMRKLAIIVGMLRIRVINPAVATAPAPM